MKKIILTLCFSVLWPLSANAADETKREAFYLALSSMSPDLSSYTFLLDELLTTRCNAAPSIQYLKNASDSYIFVLLALKNGNIKEAKTRLSSIPCEKP